MCSGGSPLSGTYGVKLPAAHVSKSRFQAKLFGIERGGNFGKGDLESKRTLHSTRS